ncbi:metallophosphoesterase [soil metagenome]
MRSTADLTQRMNITIKNWLKRLAVAAAIIIAALSLFLSYAYFIEPRQFVVIEETLAVPHWGPNLNGLRVVTIADLHTGSNYAPLERIRYVVEQANTQDPDIIVLLGDYVSESRWDRDCIRSERARTDCTELKIPAEQIADSMKGLTAKHGVYAVIGNHDWYHNEDTIYRFFENVSGIHVLNNEIAEIAINGETLRIWGIEDWYRNRRVPLEALGAVEKRNIIAITHNPDTSLNTPEGFAIMFAGHTHGGQLNWPIFGPIAVFNDPRFMDGHAVVDGKHVYVSSGVGTSVVPFRFRVPPEINVITLNAIQ